MAASEHCGPFPTQQLGKRLKGIGPPSGLPTLGRPTPSTPPALAPPAHTAAWSAGPRSRPRLLCEGPLSHRACGQVQVQGTTALAQQLSRQSVPLAEQLWVQLALQSLTAALSTAPAHLQRGLLPPTALPEQQVQAQKGLAVDDHGLRLLLPPPPPPPPLPLPHNRTVPPEALPPRQLSRQQSCEFFNRCKGAQQLLLRLLPGRARPARVLRSGGPDLEPTCGCSGAVGSIWQLRPCSLAAHVLCEPREGCARAW